MSHCFTIDCFLCVFRGGGSVFLLVATSHCRDPESFVMSCFGVRRRDGGPHHDHSLEVRVQPLYLKPDRGEAELYNVDKH